MDFVSVNAIENAIEFGIGEGAVDLVNVRGFFGGKGIAVFFVFCVFCDFCVFPFFSKIAFELSASLGESSVERYSDGSEIG